MAAGHDGQILLLLCPCSYREGGCRARRDRSDEAESVSVKASATMSVVAHNGLGEEAVESVNATSLVGPIARP